MRNVRMMEEDAEAFTVVGEDTTKGIMGVRVIRNRTTLLYFLGKRQRKNHRSGGT